MRLLSPADAKALDQETFSTTQWTSAQFIQRAGEACAQMMIQELPFFRSVLVLAGPGNNGADGIVCGEALSKKFLKKVQVLRLGQELERDLSLWLSQVDVVVDALFGVGQDRPLEGQALSWAQILTSHPRRIHLSRGSNSLLSQRTKDQKNPLRNKAFERQAKLAQGGSPHSGQNAPPGFLVVAIDTPSGLNSLTGKVFQKNSSPPASCIRADLTLTMQAPKPGFYIHDGPEVVGKVRVIKLPYPEPLYQKYSSKFYSFGVREVRGLLPTPIPQSHKTERGQVIGWVGSSSFPGAASLALGGALFSGAGFIRWARPETLELEIKTTLVSNLSLPYPEIVPIERKVSLLKQNLKSLVESTWLVGCGVPSDRHLEQLIESLLEEKTMSVVLDAGAIDSAVSVFEKKRMKAPNSWLWTPHPGELGRALGLSAEQVLEDRFSAIEEACRRFGGVWLSKGYRTILKSEDSPFLVSRVGDSRLAKAGSGDVLAGCCAGFISQGLTALRAGSLATLVQAITPDLYEGDSLSLLPSDQIRLIPKAIKVLR